jgi:hypothetical protein
VGISRILWNLVDFLCAYLPPGAAAAVRGDLEESGQSAPAAIWDALGLIARSQAELWKVCSPWAALVFLALPAGILLDLLCASIESGADLYLWIARNYADITPQTLRESGINLSQGIAGIVIGSVATIFGAWMIGYVIGELSRRAIAINGTIFALVLLFWNPLCRHYTYDVSGGWFPLEFYTLVPPNLLRMGLALAPSLWGMRLGVRRASGVMIGTFLWLSAGLITVSGTRLWLIWPFRPQSLLMLSACLTPILYLSSMSLSSMRRRKRI